MCVCVCVCVMCVRACVCACARARAGVCVCMHTCAIHVINRYQITGITYIHNRGMNE